MNRKNIANKMMILMIVETIGIILTLVIGIIVLIFINTKEPLSDVTQPEPVIREEPVKIDFEKVIEIRENAAEVMPVHQWAVYVTEDELEAMSRVVMSESSIEPYICKVAIAYVMVNRLLDGRWGDTMADVIYYPNAFSTANNGDVTDECREAVIQALQHENAFPEDMLYFRSDYYHDFGEPYVSLGNMYFTTETCYGGL